jgi:hypothetical protein
MQTSTEAALAELARAQCDVLTPAQLTACGVPGSTVQDRCRPGAKWQRPLPRVVVLHNGPLSWQQRYWSAVLYGSAGGRAVVTGRSALALYRLKAAPSPEDVTDIDVLVPRSSHMPSRRAAWQGEVTILRTRRMPPRVRMNTGLPVAALPRAAVDSVRHIGDGRGDRGWAQSVLYEVVQARGVAPTALAAELRAERIAGRAWVQEVLAALLINEWHHGRTAYTPQSLKQRYIAITDRRNRIAHDADLLDGDLKRRRPISDAEVIDAIDWIERIALAIAKVLG